MLRPRGSCVAPQILEADLNDAFLCMSLEDTAFAKDVNEAGPFYSVAVVHLVQCSGL